MFQKIACITVAVTGIGCTLFLKWFIKHKYKAWIKDLKQEAIDDECYYHSIFINPYDNAVCYKHIFSAEECKESCSFAYLQKLVKFIESANSTVSLCVYTITVESVIEALQSTTARGIRVRIITDRVMTQTNKSVGRNGKGLEIRCQDSSDNNSMMHHKFCLVDEQSPENGKLFMGSMNITLQALCSNFEHILFTNNQKIISKFSEEFESLWSTLPSFVPPQEIV